jgi:hypothetical protein
MEIEKRNLWMPISKNAEGAFVGILSDNSIDRDNEFMSKELLQNWVKDTRALPMLANHENKLEKLIGGWHEKQLISNGDNHAMTAKPFFLESNPLGRQAKAMVEEAIAKGLGVGISIGAIPKGEMVEKEVDGKKFKGFKEAEILEATIVPIQSNRNATFMAMAKSFDINMEETKMSEIKKEEIQGLPEELKAEEPKEEPKVDAPVEEEPKAEEKPVEEEPKAEVVEEVVDADKLKIIELTKKLEALEKKAVLKATVEGPVEKEVVPEPTFKNLLKQKYGGQ